MPRSKDEIFIVITFLTRHPDLLLNGTYHIIKIIFISKISATKINFFLHCIIGQRSSFRDQKKKIQKSIGIIQSTPNNVILILLNPILCANTVSEGKMKIIYLREPFAKAYIMVVHENLYHLQVGSDDYVTHKKQPDNC